MPTVSRRARTLRRTVGALLADPTAPVAEQRAAMDRAGHLPRPRHLQYVETTVGGVPTIVATPTNGPVERHILYLHGGGYAVGSPRSHIAMCARLAKLARASISVIDYRMAPEHPYPAAIEDCVAAYRAIIDGHDPASVVLAGDSAGGGAALATLCALRQAGDPLPAAAYLLSPWTDLTGSGDSTVTKAAVDPMIQVEALHAFADRYVGDHALDDPGVSPLFADLSGLPPMLVQVGSDEVLLSDSTRLVARARAAGVTADIDVAPGMWHVYQAFAGMVPEATGALTEAAAFIRAKTPVAGLLQR